VPVTDCQITATVTSCWLYGTSD